jgi:thiamine-phosphate pyrophosphorylase
MGSGMATSENLLEKGAQPYSRTPGCQRPAALASMNVSLRPTLPEGLYALCDDGLGAQPLVHQARCLLEGGASTLQLRLKRTSMRAALPLAKEIAALCRAGGARLIVNDRPDLALLCGADGVHVGDEDLPAEAVRALVGPGLLVGVTVRDLGQAQQAHAAGADYVGLGPVFPTRTKQVDAVALGVEGLRAIAERAPLPVVAIAGIGPDNIEEVARAGAHAAAVGSALWAEPSAERTRALVLAFARGRGGRS